MTTTLAKDKLTLLETVQARVKTLITQPNVTNPPATEIRVEAERYGTVTKWGNYNFVSTVKNRSAGLTIYLGSEKVTNRQWSPKQQELIKVAPQTLQSVLAYLDLAPFIHLKRVIGSNPDFAPQCHLFVSVHRKEMIRLAHMWGQTNFIPAESGEPVTRDGIVSTGKVGPEQYVVYIPEWQEKDRQIIVLPEYNVTFVLGSDYYGESKKGHLRLAMWNAKALDKGLGLHAGSKIVYARSNRTGKLKKYCVLIFGLTATGKTTHSCHTHGLNESAGEKIEILQDDVVILKRDGSALGTERGFYLKTEGVNPDSQPVIYQAVTSPDCIFENVMVDWRGQADFDNEVLTGNGRGVMQRYDFGKYAPPEVNSPPINELDGLIFLFITRRNTVVPLLSKLNLEQAAATFMLGESIESSGSDPKRAGESVREVGTNPFIVGSLAEEGNIFYEMLKSLPAEKVQCYLVNTGGVGEVVEKNPDGTKTIKQRVVRPEVLETAANIRNILRESIEWEKEPDFGTYVPARSPEGIDLAKFDIKKFYSSADRNLLVRTLIDDRVKWLEQFSGLERVILQAVKP